MYLIHSSFKTSNYEIFQLSKFEGSLSLFFFLKEIVWINSNKSFFVHNISSAAIQRSGISEGLFTAYFIWKRLQVGKQN